MLTTAAHEIHLPPSLQDLGRTLTSEGASLSNQAHDEIVDSYGSVSVQVSYDVLHHQSSGVDDDKVEGGVHGSPDAGTWPSCYCDCEGRKGLMGENVEFMCVINGSMGGIEV